MKLQNLFEGESLTADDKDTIGLIISDTIDQLSPYVKNSPDNAQEIIHLHHILIKLGQDKYAAKWRDLVSKLMDTV